MEIISLIVLFNVLSLITIFIPFFQKESYQPTTTAAYKKFQLEYFIVYFLMTLSDWLQGPYVYAIYSSYGFTIGEIGFLFMAGFGSSMLMGTFVGGLADTLGRKRICLAFVVLYIISCLTKHINSFYILLIGRITGGTATSILFSAFDSWLIYEHQARGFHPEWLSNTFSIASIGNSASAIAAGIIATSLTMITGSLTAPFDCAIVFLLIGGVIILTRWTENYGDKSGPALGSFSKGWELIRSNPTVLSLGISQSLFESAMYIFVFMWTPTLSASWENDLNGLIFSCFMVSVMLGSNIFSIYSQKLDIEKILFFQFILSTLSLSLPVFSGNPYICLISFLLFECCVGLFWPSIGTLKGKYISEEVRSTVLNYFRIPTNFFVLTTLSLIEKFSRSTVFSICVFLLLAGSGASYYVLQKEVAPNYLSTLVKGNSEKDRDSDIDSDEVFDEMMSRPTTV